MSVGRRSDRLDTADCGAPETTCAADDDDDDDDANGSERTTSRMRSVSAAAAVVDLMNCKLIVQSLFLLCQISDVFRFSFFANFQFYECENHGYVAKVGILGPRM